MVDAADAVNPDRVINVLSDRIAALENENATLSAKEKITLRYWNVQGRGQVARYMLYDNGTEGVDFEDEVMDGVKIFGGGLWPAMKFDESKSGRLHAFPVLEHKGRSLNETNAIAYYVADQCGYLPADSMDRAEVLMISDHLYEGESKLLPANIVHKHNLLCVLGTRPRSDHSYGVCDLGVS